MIKKVNENNTNINTYYLLGGFQYEEIITSTTAQMPQLKFFPHAEGYVNVEQGRSTSYFNYVFNYTDHLGNIRLSYAYDPSIQTTKIIEENHYYAFGLKHTGYNSDLLLWMEDIVTDKMSLRKMFTPKSSGYQYKYQGQERQTELGLNWDSFKWRNYDPAIGRFMSIDPLTEDYRDWNPYAFSGNRVIDSRELEGLEPYSVHNTYSEAVSNFAQYYNGYSMNAYDGQGVEVATKFYQNQDGTYSYARPKEFIGGGADPRQISIPDGTNFVGTGHTHGNNNGSQYMTDSDNNNVKVDGLSPEKILNYLSKGYNMEEGANGPSKGVPGDLHFVEGVDAKSETFKGSFVITPSGLVYIIKLDKNGNAFEKIDFNITKTTPSSGDVRVNNINPTIELKEEEKPLQGTVTF